MLPLVTAAVVSLVGCGSSAAEEEAARQARMTLDDGAVPMPAGATVLSGGFDRSTAELNAALPLATLQRDYSEVQTMAAESFIPSEAAGCKPSPVREPALPAAEALATKPPGAGRHQPETADVVASRGRTDTEASQLIDAVKKAAAGCTSFASDLKDLGEGSFAPAEKGSTAVADAAVKDWTGVRTTTQIALTGKGWSEQTARESLVLRRGQVVVHIKVEGPEVGQVTDRASRLAEETITAIESEK